MALFDSNGVQSSANVTSQAVTTNFTPPQNSIIILGSNTGPNGTGSTTFPSGFGSIPGISQLVMPSSGNFLTFAYKIGGASEPSSYTVTYGFGNWCALQVWVLTGRNTAAPFTAVNSNTIASSAPPLSVALNGVTAAAGDDILWLCGVAQTDVAVTFTQPSGFTNSLNTTGATGGFQVSSAGAIKQNVASGATGVLTGTEAWSGSANDAGGAVISLAQGSLNPASGALTLTGQAPRAVQGTVITVPTAKVIDKCREAIRSIFLAPRLGWAT